ncbi:DUF2690 domain-containing protein [Streptomyces andamanensis]|uniref:DUF2690 domain-containing protein n=1 Tax=Streptomyces andamanensis TaxID=1565035 RepID=A0ABV8TJ17_9ACTN
MVVPRIGTRAAVLVATAALFAGLGGTVAATSATAADTSAAGTCTFAGPKTVKTAKVDSINIELRYSTSTRCAWGRIYSADPGDKVWVDRSSDKGKSWDGPLSMTAVKSGSDTHTASRYDGGYVMRACAWNDSTGHIKCTGWY